MPEGGGEEEKVCACAYCECVKVCMFLTLLCRYETILQKSGGSAES